MPRHFSRVVLLWLLVRHGWEPVFNVLVVSKFRFVHDFSAQMANGLFFWGLWGLSLLFRSGTAFRG